MVENKRYSNRLLFKRVGLTQVALVAENNTLREKLEQLNQLNLAILNQEDSNRRTALMRAAQNGHEKVVELLLGALNKFDTTTNKSELKAALNQKGPKGITALWIAAQNGHEKVVELLLGALNKFDTTTNKSEFKTALNKTARNQKDLYVRTALMIAAENGHTEVVRLLVGALNKFDTTTNKSELKAALNQKRPDGVTALWVAAQKGHTEVVMLLVGALNKFDTTTNKSEFKTALNQKGLLAQQHL